MPEQRRFQVPGTNRTIDVPHRTLTPREGSGAIEVPGVLPPHFREIVAGSAAGKHWLDGAFGPPYDPPGFMFLGRAVRKFGHALYGDEWIGTEPAVDTTAQTLPELGVIDLLLDRTSDIIRAKDVARQILAKGYGDNISPEDWQEARRRREEAVAVVAPARARMLGAFNTVQEALADGTLPFSLMPVGGGAPSPLRPPSEWLAPRETLFVRLLSGKMSATLPFKPAGADHWIVVGATQVTEVLKTLIKPKPSVPLPTRAPASRRAKYIKRVHQAVKANPDGPSERDDLIKEGRDVWNLGAKGAEVAFKEAVDTVGIPHKWSKTGPKPKAKQ